MATKMTKEGHFQVDIDIPPTIESCGGSLHSEDDSEPFVDNTEGNLFSDDSEKIANENENNGPISKRDKAFEGKWKGLVSFMLFANALIITGSTYAFLNANEQQDFVASFERHAGAIVDKCHYHASSVAVTFESVSDSITSYVHDSGSQWPFVTVSDFEVHSIHTREASFSELVGFVPLIPNARRMKQWETYAAEHVDQWLTESRLTQVKVNPGPRPAVDKDSRESGDNGNRTAVPEAATATASNETTRMLQQNQTDQTPQTATGPFAPIWQLSPPPTSKEMIGFDLLTHDILERLLFAMWETQNMVLSPVMDVSFLTEWTPRNSQQRDLNATSPRSVVFQPIYEEHNFHDENSNMEAPRLQGLYFGVLAWESYLEGLVPEGVKGIYCVVRNDCGQDYTFVINGKDAVFIGEGDHHDPRYDANEVSTQFSELEYQDQSSSTEQPIDDNFHCSYSLSIYPSIELQENQQSSTPFFFTMIVGLIFVVTFFFFLGYLKLAEHRTKKVEKVAKASDKIISSLFPQNVKNVLMNDAQQDEAQTRSMNTTSHGGGGLSSQVQEFLSNDEESAFMSGSMGTSSMAASSSRMPNPYQQYKTKPIANLFEETTIFFADISGFTAWSATRSPTEVFELLESIYGCFDKLAKKRHVYKVETIGDCYVAVTGLPKPNKRHALEMTRFAQDCLNHISKVTKSLEESLGKDTSDLTMRIGLHSGPVTAGVLRGERSRFQLFGDTVNTAARMESNGKPNCIHVSEATAELLRTHGRGAWLRKREDLVEAKGKGLMQTYFVVARAGAASGTGTDISSQSGETYPSRDMNATFHSGESVERDRIEPPSLLHTTVTKEVKSSPIESFGDEIEDDSTTDEVSFGAGSQ
ncbi:Receptor-type guanylate cyclase gcy [Seminavis robusta]|uniref:Receptor-type guanylate cyclase gcy n=1 Tax=Seminavis robusta TaxID=568900 RepID=A0A9N8DE70_9STRA|nr:Receptor-type guanylate cyclase gcy [Seminavis robusta]|eukprot:Sro53_g031540.1 Receptor-type guanylate cyclase gcy (869) ;mRNA; f:115947-119797